MPQEASWSGLHWLLAQQPAGHEVASQTHTPALQRWPALHSASRPQAQAPAVQRSARARSQAAQAAPGAPQALVEPGWQLPEASQQPVGHEAPSHTQPPFRQRWPTPQAAPTPQAQPPEALQPSAVVVSQAAQAAPRTPQVMPVVVEVTQSEPEQQPDAHEVALQPEHEPLSQVSAPGQALQARPALPQTPGVLPRTQAPEASQQPVGQEVGVQLHTPKVHCSPLGQGAPAPQPQLPAVQLSVFRPGQAWQSAPWVPHCP
jgi:hypothetical protein